jgi:hypothetical protein
MTAILDFAPGMLTVPGAYPYHNGMDIIPDPAALPKDRSAIPDDTLITPAVWAALQGVTPASVLSNKSKHDRRRGTPEARPGDMPPASRHRIGQTPTWTMGAYRAWDAARPGKGKGAGRPVTRTGPRARVTLPISCPHCHHEITKDDLRQQVPDAAPPKAKLASRKRPAIKAAS